MELKLHAFDLPLKHVFTISRGSVSIQPTLIVELTDGEFHGFGESTTNDYYGYTLENMAAALNEVGPRLAASSQVDPAKLWTQLDPSLRHNRFAQCALDLAAWDLWGKQQGKPTYALWGLSVDQIPVSDYTIGIDSIDKMVAKLEEMPDWPVYKIKMGTPHDIETIRQLRGHTRAVFRVDANGAWTVARTLHNAVQLKELNVEFIEQPLPADELESMGEVREKSVLPVIADENCITEADVERCKDRFHGINIKLCKCGGLTPARRMIDQARRFGMRVMVGCMTESTVGISAIAQLLPLLDFVDMDGALLLASDIATGVRVDHGVCHYPDVHGNGCQLIDSGHLL